jgi:acyl-CoA synthetase (AMP-forming)/AMP-acid ligase II
VGRDRAGRATYSQLTFRQLDQESDRLAAGLQRIGVQPGQRIVLMVRPSLEFIALTFALFKAGAVIVLIDPGMGRTNIFNCLEEVDPDGFVAIPVVHWIRTLSRKFPRARLNVRVGRGWGPGCLATYQSLLESGWEPDPGEGPIVRTQATDPAAVIFTSGSTGPPKGVLYEHGMFNAQVDLLQEFYGIEPGEVDLPGFPLFGLFNAAMGVTTVIPDMDPTKPAQVDPLKIIEAIRDNGVTQAFGSPALWNRVGSYCVENGIVLPSLRRAMSAGGPVPIRVLEMMTQVLTGTVPVPEDSPRRHGDTEKDAGIAASSVSSEVWPPSTEECTVSGEAIHRAGEKGHPGSSGIGEGEAPAEPRFGENLNPAHAARQEPRPPGLVDSQTGQLRTIPGIVRSAPLSVLPCLRGESLSGPRLADLHTPYGATESLPVASISSREVLTRTAEKTRQGAGTCVGRAFPGVDIRIIPVTDGPIGTIEQTRFLPVSEIGEIIVRSPSVTREYFRRPEPTAAAKIPDGETFWHRIGDVGYLDDEGLLWFCGRKAHIVYPVDGPMYSVCCEGILDTHPKVFRSAVVGIGVRGKQTPVAVIELMPGAGSQAGIQQELRKLALSFPLTAGIEKFEFIDAMPVDTRHNVKINREALAEWATKRLSR